MAKCSACNQEVPGTVTKKGPTRKELAQINYHAEALDMLLREYWPDVVRVATPGVEELRHAPGNVCPPIYAYRFVRRPS